jgi:dTDP-4-dehydrorhamnose reductase
VTLERVLVTGGGGQLASDLEEQLAGRSLVRASPRTELDVTDDHAVEAAFRELRPDTVINCAAFHNLDACEREEDRSFEVNARAVKRLGARCREEEAKLVHLSTNYVFDGTSDRPYEESDRPNPRSVYAISKLAGEYAALAYAPGSLVVRSAGLYGLHGSASKGGNFVTRMLARAREQGELRMVADQRLNPTFTSDLATGLIAAIDAGASGVLHITNSGECSWLEFTEAIMELAGVEVPLEAVDTTVPPGGVERPLNGVLAAPGAKAAGLEPLRHWRDALADYMERAGLRAAGVA